MPLCAIIYYMENMENNQRTERRRKEERRSLMRRLRLPVLVVLGVLITAFVLIPMAFEMLNIVPTVVEVSAEMVSAPVKTPEPALTAEPEAVAEEPASRYVVLQLGDTHADVAAIQERLTELQYIDGDEPSENFNEPIQAAVKRFQGVHHMKETGVADELTQELLFSADAQEYSLHPGYSGEDVESLQERLLELGYEVEKTNGYFGTATTRALTSFQNRNKLNATGVMDSETSDILYSNNARPKVDPTPTPTIKPKTPKPEKTPKPTKAPESGGNDSSGEIAVTKTAKPQTSGGGSVSAATGDVSGFIATLKAQQGKPYVLGDEGPSSFDCSGLVYYGLTNNGVKVGRLSAKSYAVIDSWETIESKGGLQTGDLIFFWNDGKTRISHTGVWLGGNQYIHASSSAGKVVISSWSNWAERCFSHGKRVF